ncbi:NADH-dependent flavin oxidoreductase [Staphylococcus equorum]|uniref:NADH-dependent flavin oxidoreductase n=1 Tax=Staphylococcus equorum TaxID=246432 RepID=A0A9X4LBW3_9STAP|nr:NADH-dependent flavin oxidoreductase [Staphylococcus equorum]MDG0860632.1 NADH-dependent flavin oxidoreductase [Staphylococcus equorum]
MKRKYEPLFQAFQLTEYIELKNRFVLAPLTHLSSNEDGSISEEELIYIENKSKDVGMAITAAVYTSFNGIAVANQASIAEDKFIDGLKKQAAVMKKHDAKAILQLQHAGGLGYSELLPNKQPLGPSNIQREGYSQPKSLEHDEILEIIKDFGKATRRAIQAGFDGVEIHGANHYLIHQFCSPYYNRRNDKWSDLSSFALKIIKEVLKVKSEENKAFIVGYRFSPEEPERGGIKMEDTYKLLQKIIKTDLDYLHASTMHVTSNVKEGNFKGQNKLELLRKWIPLEMPLIGVGSMYSPDQAVEVLNQDVPLIALGRPLLIDSNYIQKIIEGKEDTIEKALEYNRIDKHGLTQIFYEDALKSDWMPTRDKYKSQISGGEEDKHKEYK